MAKAFTGICIITRDVRRLGAFYEHVLEVTAEGGGEHLAFSLPNASLAIFSVEGTESMAPGSMAGAGTGGFTVGIRVDDVDAEFERLTQAGVPVVKPPATYAWGTRSAWFRDPDGNIVNLHSPAAVQVGYDCGGATRFGCTAPASGGL